MTGTVSIIIPTYNGLAMLKRCVKSIYAHTQDVPYEIIVVDNASKDGTAEWCLKQRLTFVSLPRNEGFPAGCNHGLRLAAGETLVLLNNDTVLTKAWLANLTKALYSAQDIGIVGPVSNYASGSQQVDFGFTDMDDFQRIASQLNVSDPSAWRQVKRIVGVCFVFRRSLMEQIGLLDERFGLGHYEDDDYCLRARQHGYRLIVCHDALIYHEGSASFRKKGLENQQELVERNYRLFKKKWKQDPRKLI